MVKTRVLFPALCMATLALASSNVFAQGAKLAPKQAVTTGSSIIHPVTPPPPGVSVLYSSLGPKSDPYDDEDGWLIAGPDNGYDDENQAIANPFTLSANSTVEGIQIALTYYGYGDNSSYVAIFTDEGGLPGKPIKAWKVTNLPTFGSGYGLVTIKDAAGVPITGGTQYWLVAGTDGSGENGTVDVWNWTYNDSQGPMAFENAGTDDLWTAYEGNDAFALYGQ